MKFCQIFLQEFSVEIQLMFSLDADGLGAGVSCNIKIERVFLGWFHGFFSFLKLSSYRRVTVRSQVAANALLSPSQSFVQVFNSNMYEMLFHFSAPTKD